MFVYLFKAGKKKSREDSDPVLREARKRAAEKLVQVVMAEDDSVLMLQQITERLRGEKGILRSYEKYDAGKVEEQRKIVEMLTSEQQTLIKQLQDLRTVRTNLEENLQDSKTAPKTENNKQDYPKFSTSKRGTSANSTSSRDSISRDSQRSIPRSSASSAHSMVYPMNELAQQKVMQQRMSTTSGRESKSMYPRHSRTESQKSFHSENLGNRNPSKRTHRESKPTRHSWASPSQSQSMNGPSVDLIAVQRHEQELARREEETRSVYL